MKYVALYRGKEEYLYGYINELGDFEVRSELNNKKPPIISRERLETVKKLDIPELGYAEQESKNFIIFNNHKFEYIEYNLPVYVKVLNKLTLTKERTKLKILTDESLNAAKELYTHIEKEIFKIDHKDEIDKLKAVIDKGNGIALIQHSDFPNISRILFYCEEFINLFEYQYDFYVIGMKKSPRPFKLALNVPESIIGKIIGKGGKNIRQMQEKLGIMKIIVTSK